MPAYSNLRVKDVSNSNPAHPDQIGVERNGNTVYLSNANRDLAASDMILTESTASLKVAAEDAGGATSVDAVDITGADVVIVDYDIITHVDEYYDDNGHLVRDLETDTDITTVSILG
jgi:hypothetical protein